MDACCLLLHLGIEKLARLGKAGWTEKTIFTCSFWIIMFCRAVFTYLLLSLLDFIYLLISLLDCTYFFGSCLEKPDIEKEMNALHYLMKYIFYCLADNLICAAKEERDGGLCVWRG